MGNDDGGGIENVLGIIVPVMGGKVTAPEETTGEIVIVEDESLCQNN